ncbi:hypothetical protein CLOP_g10152 [Closterium sp. NIES-67]|nr:hypothetical protein CLOP_g10152 [Closterium sp. NIES-67]
MLVAAGKIRAGSGTRDSSTAHHPPGSVAALAPAPAPAAMPACGSAKATDGEEEEDEEDVEWEEGGVEEEGRSDKGDVKGGGATEKDVQGKGSAGHADVDMEADVEWEKAPVQQMKQSGTPPTPQPAPAHASPPAMGAAAAAASAPSHAGGDAAGSAAAERRGGGAWEEQQVAEAIRRSLQDVGGRRGEGQREGSDGSNEAGRDGRDWRDGRDGRDGRCEEGETRRQAGEGAVEGGERGGEELDEERAALEEEARKLREEMEEEKRRVEQREQEEGVEEQEEQEEQGMRMDEGEWGEDEEETRRRWEEESEQLEREGRRLRQQKRANERDAASVTSDMMAEVQELLQLFGVPYVVAPVEAEAQCAFLCRQGLVHAVVTDDCDALLFGAPTVWRHLFSERQYVEVYKAEDVRRELGLGRRHLIRMAMLLGCDYTPGISGIGVVNAIEVVHAFPGARGLARFRQWLDAPHAAALARLLPARTGGAAGGDGGAGADGWGKDDGWWEDESSDEEEEEERGERAGSGKKDEGVGSLGNWGREAEKGREKGEEKGKRGSEEGRASKRELADARRREFEATHAAVRRQWVVPESFPSAAVAAAFNAPHVDRSTASLSWDAPDLPALRNLCVAKLGMAPDKADALLLPVVKAFNSRQTQQRLEAFYSFNQRFAKIRSRRVQRAVTGIAGSAARHLMLPPCGVSAAEDDAQDAAPVAPAHANTAAAAGGGGDGGGRQCGTAVGGGGANGTRRGKGKRAAEGLAAAAVGGRGGRRKVAEVEKAVGESASSGEWQEDHSHGGHGDGVAQRQDAGNVDGGVGVRVRVQPGREAKRPKLQLAASPAGCAGGGVVLSDSDTSSSGSDSDGDDAAFDPSDLLAIALPASSAALHSPPTARMQQQPMAHRGAQETVGRGGGMSGARADGGEGQAAGVAGEGDEREAGMWVVQRHSSGAEGQQDGMHKGPKHAPGVPQERATPPCLATRTPMSAAAHMSGTSAGDTAAVGGRQEAAACSSAHALMYGGGFCEGEGGEAAEDLREGGEEEERQSGMEHLGGRTARTGLANDWGVCREMGEEGKTNACMGKSNEEVAGGRERVDAEEEVRRIDGGMTPTPPVLGEKPHPTHAALPVDTGANTVGIGLLLAAPLRRKKPRKL